MFAEGGMDGTDGTLGIAGQRTSGAAVRQANVTAALAIANIVKSSLGPLGLDKMLLDNMGEPHHRPLVCTIVHADQNPPNRSCIL